MANRHIKPIVMKLPTNRSFNDAESLYPLTSTDQVLDPNTGEKLTDKLKNINGDIVAGAQQQSDWANSTEGSVTYIKNKPTKVSDFTNDANYATVESVTAGLETCASKEDVGNINSILEILINGTLK